MEIVLIPAKILIATLNLEDTEINTVGVKLTSMENEKWSFF